MSALDEAREAVNSHRGRRGQGVLAAYWETRDLRRAVGALIRYLQGVDVSRARIGEGRMKHSCDAQLRADPAFDPFLCRPSEWTCTCGRRFVHVCDEAEGCFFEVVE